MPRLLLEEGVNYSKPFLRGVGTPRRRATDTCFVTLTPLLLVVRHRDDGFSKLLQSFQSILTGKEKRRHHDAINTQRF